MSATQEAGGNPAPVQSSSQNDVNMMDANVGDVGGSEVKNGGGS